MSQPVWKDWPSPKGNQAARGGFSVRYQRLTRLLDELALARVDGKATRLLAQLARIQLLIIDDWAMARLTAEQRRDLMEVIDDRHQRASTILATQIPIERWHGQGPKTTRERTSGAGTRIPSVRFRPSNRTNV